MSTNVSAGDSTPTTFEKRGGRIFCGGDVLLEPFIQAGFVICTPTVDSGSGVDIITAECAGRFFLRSSWRWSCHWESPYFVIRREKYAGNRVFWQRKLYLLKRLFKNSIVAWCDVKGEFPSRFCKKSKSCLCRP